ncbi:MAG: conjugal transfer protein TraE [Nitrococcus mobilis]|nr:conjugal transfer protein TraE [Nitrococcus mobilis]
MDFGKFKIRLSSSQTENRWLRWVALGLLVANVVLAVAVFSVRTVVTIQPPGLNEAVRITQNEANAAYKKAWGLFVANLLGNVKPGSADFIVAALTPLLASDLYRPVVDAIRNQAAKIDRARVATTFTAHKVLYDPKTDTVYVRGRQTSAGPGSDSVTDDRTYELVVSIRGYKPVISEFKVYSEAPRLEENS